ncbi:PiggyBac transposable element-derived protein 3 [Elysia marginata]|uniref:PiggyBac transposable element-derived protein 3 n=1 Tax=Elysia marginata TaxID=1093978 RepID=A0AAV4IPB1_9GAST|nr:PiggyBac transposable element-derived protein 3 [Elysia marginata]
MKSLTFLTRSVMVKVKSPPLETSTSLLCRIRVTAMKIALPQVTFMLLLQKNKKRKRQLSEDDPDDNIPLSSLKQKISQQREEDDLEIISQMLNEPMWEDVEIANVDTTFKGDTEQLPEGGVKTPYAYFRNLITDAMLENVELQSNNYALTKSGIELKATKKEVDIFIGLYLRMGLMKAHSVRAYWAADTRYPPVADVVSRNRFEILARHIHFCDNNSFTEEQMKADKIWKVRSWVEGFRESFTKIAPLQNQSVDEVMVAFKGRSGLKQYLRNTPRKWGFKLYNKKKRQTIFRKKLLPLKLLLLKLLKCPENSPAWNHPKKSAMMAQTIASRSQLRENARFARLVFVRLNHCKKCDVRLRIKKKNNCFDKYHYFLSEDC